MNMEVVSIKLTEYGKPEKHGCSPCATDPLFKFPFFILKSQLKSDFYFMTNITSIIDISKYLLMILNKKIN